MAWRFLLTQPASTTGLVDVIGDKYSECYVLPEHGEPEESALHASSRPIVVVLFWCFFSSSWTCIQRQRWTLRSTDRPNDIPSYTLRKELVNSVRSERNVAIHNRTAIDVGEVAVTSVISAAVVSGTIHFLPGFSLFLQV